MFPVEPAKVSITFVIGIITEMNSVTPSKYQDRHTQIEKKRQKQGGEKKSWQNKLVQRCVCVRGTVLFSSCIL